MGQYMQYIIIVIILVVVAIAITKAKRKDFKIEINKLVSYLGGKNNIIDYEVNKSRFVVTLKNINIVNKEGIQKMGARGIVEIDNQLKIILGDNANQLKKHIDELKWFNHFFIFPIIRHNSTYKKCIIMSRWWKWTFLTILYLM